MAFKATVLNLRRRRVYLSDEGLFQSRKEQWLGRVEETFRTGNNEWLLGIFFHDQLATVVLKPNI